MARYHRPNCVLQTFTVACGASDADNLVDACVPSDNCTLVESHYTIKSAGVGTGSFGVQITYGQTSPTAAEAATATTFIDPDGAAGTIAGSNHSGVAISGAQGEHLNVTTVKAGTVSGNATLIVQLLWQL